MLELTVKPNRRDLTRVAGEFRTAAHRFPRIRGQAVRSTTKFIQRRARAITAKELGVPQKTLKARGAVRYRFTRGQGGPVGSVTTISSRRLSARHFKPTQRKKGVSLRIARRRRVYPGTFFAPISYRSAGGNTGNVDAVAIREDSGRLPIAMLHGPSPGHVAQGLDAIRDLADREAPERLTEEVRTKLRRYIDLQRKRAAGVVR